MLGECGEVTTDAWLEKYVEEYAKFTAGTCASVGYTHADGEKKVEIPVVGEVDLQLFSKPAEAQQPHKQVIRTMFGQDGHGMRNSFFDKIKAFGHKHEHHEHKHVIFFFLFFFSSLFLHHGCKGEFLCNSSFSHCISHSCISSIFISVSTNSDNLVCE